MQEFLINIIPRILKYSSQLDRKELFIEKPWVFIDSNNINHEYMFMRDNKLIMSLNGAVKIGTWQLLPHNKLLIDRLDDKILLENMFVNDGLLILKKSGSNEMPFVLMDERKVPNLDPVTYLEDFERTKIIANTNAPINFLINDEEMDGNATYLGAKVLGKDEKHIISGTYKVRNYNGNKFCIVKNGIIIGFYYLIKYSVVNNYNTGPIKSNPLKKIIIKQADPAMIRKGDTISDFDNSEFTGNKFDIVCDDHAKYTIHFEKNGYILKVDSDGYLFAIIGSILLFVVIIFYLLKYQFY